MKASPKKGCLSTYFYKNRCPKALLDTTTVFFAFPASPTMYGAGGKNMRFFYFFSYFFGHFENRSSRASVGNLCFRIDILFEISTAPQVHGRLRKLKAKLSERSHLARTSASVAGT